MLIDKGDREGLLNRTMGSLRNIVMPLSGAFRLETTWIVSDLLLAIREVDEVI